MPSHDEERIQVAASVRTSIAIEDVLVPLQARSFVRCLQTSWQVPTIRWRDIESSQQFDDAFRLIHSAEIYYQVEGSDSDNAIQCYRRAAELFEWLSRANDSIHPSSLINLFTGASYQLGGLPAMAFGFLGQVELADKGSQLYAKFFRADFDGVLNLAKEFWLNNYELTEFNSSEELLAEEIEDKISWYITVELVRCLGLISDSLRRGDNKRLEQALTKLGALDRLAVRSFSNYSSMLITLLSRVAKKYSDSSIYNPTLHLAELKPEMQSWLKRFARRQFKQGRGILWTSQQYGIDRLLHQSSFALCTPTGSGKTLVATFALVKELLLQKEEGEIAPLALYLVPSRALACEVEAKLTSELGNEFIVTGLYGGADWGITDFWLTADKPTVLIATVEKADALMRYLGSILLARLTLFIVDEAHQVVPEDNDYTRNSFSDHSSRSIRLEGFVARLLTLSPEIVRIALTAVAGGASLPVAKWIEGNDEAEAVGVQYRSTRQIVGMLQTSPRSSGRMLLDMMNGQPLYVQDRNEPVYINLNIPIMPQLPASMRNSIYRFNQLTVLWTSLHLVDDKRRVLISVAQRPEQTMKWYKEALDLKDWKDIGSFAPPDDEYQLAKFQEARAACIDYCGKDSYEVALLDRGIATNYGQMPQRLRRLMTALIDQGICPITVATATLTEGVNLPFDLIFLTALKRTMFNNIQQRLEDNLLSASEFNNLAGRAGRPGATNGMEGLTLVAVPQQPSTTAAGGLATQQRQIKYIKDEYISFMQNLHITAEASLNGPLALLLKSIADRVRDLYGVEGNNFLEWLERVTPEVISDDAGKGVVSEESRLADSVDELDGILLSALEEFSCKENQALEGAEAEAFLANLWRNTFTRVAQIQETWLEEAFIRRGSSIINTIYTDTDERERLYQYGFTPYIGRRFERIAPDIRAIIETTEEYGDYSLDDRFSVFVALGELLKDERGFGFRVRDTQSDMRLLENWVDVLAWWMQIETDNTPAPNELRSWQRFVTDNLEFRLGVAIGAVVAYAWSDGADDPMEVPSLEKWKTTTGLPWFGFWARELLRWGTLDPFVAFAMAQGLARTRDEAAEQRSVFEAWLAEKYEDLTADDKIDPQRFLKWERTLLQSEQAAQNQIIFDAKLTEPVGKFKSYNVIPLKEGEELSWIDASGYELAKSQFDESNIDSISVKNDYELQIENDSASVRKV